MSLCHYGISLLSSCEAGVYVSHSECFETLTVSLLSVGAVPTGHLSPVCESEADLPQQVACVPQ